MFGITKSSSAMCPGCLSAASTRPAAATSNTKNRKNRAVSTFAFLCDLFIPGTQFDVLTCDYSTGQRTCQSVILAFGTTMSRTMKGAARTSIFARWLLRRKEKTINFSFHVCRTVGICRGQVEREEADNGLCCENREVNSGAQCYIVAKPVLNGACYSLRARDEGSARPRARRKARP